MRVTKPLKVPALTRVTRDGNGWRFHVTAMLGFPLGAPRSLLDEMTFWSTLAPALGTSLLDEGVSKERGEFLVNGTCYAPGGTPVRQAHALARVGTLEKRVAVFGDRYWTERGPSEPVPFASMPLDWMHAFGGPDYAPNRLGMGTKPVELRGNMVQPLPNLERPEHLLRSPEDRPKPTCFSAMDLTFEARVKRAGTFGPDYVERWAPGLPPDALPTFHNVADDDQWHPTRFIGDETFLLENMHPTRPRLEGVLPGLTSRAFITRHGSESREFEELAMACDTVWLFPSHDVGVVVFHGSVPVESDDAAGIRDLLVACEELGQAMNVDHYRRSLERRSHRDTAHIAGLSDSDLMPHRNSGVVANVSGMDVMEWVRSEQLAERNQRRGAERQRERSRQLLLAEGLNPAEFGLDEPLPPIDPVPVDDPDALAAYLVKAEETFEAVQTKLESRKDAAQARANEGAARMGESDLLAQPPPDEPPPGGPPTFKAADQLAHLGELAAEAREGGVPNPELERLLVDPEHHAQLARMEAAAKEGYRSGAHRLPAALPMTEEASSLARLVVAAARETDEPLEGRDLTGADLRGCDLSGMRLSRAMLEGADLRGCNLCGADLSYAVLARADLLGANLLGANLLGANLGAARLDGACLDEADLTGAVLARATVVDARIRKAVLTRADVSEVAWDGVDLSSARLEFVTFLKSTFVQTKFNGAHFERAMWVECVLDEADFSEANLSRASFVACRGVQPKFARARLAEAVLGLGTAFSHADFSDVLAERACFRTARLEGARFDRAQLSMADLSEVDATASTFDRAVMKGALLIRTKLDGASLRGVNLTEALLSKSIVTRTDFTGSNLTRADLMGAVGDTTTRFNETVTHHTKWGRNASGGSVR